MTPSTIRVRWKTIQHHPCIIKRVNIICIVCVPAESGFRPNSTGGGSSGEDDLGAQFDRERAKSRLKISVVAGAHLPGLSVNDFFNLYIAESAPFSFKK